ncbi:CocE/NonD family hydrolase [Marivirga sp.]|uniref:CocE/NonD family hydrolase n=1 Tax=Marivirga sp. TaxID=2018662 RepID=UPI0025ED3730|nr:CocE/NonD family hydrolase [Marivirga sp.]
MNRFLTILFLICINLPTRGQELKVQKVGLSDKVALEIEMQNLAKNYLQKSQIEDHNIEPNNLYMFEILAGNYEASLMTLSSLRANVGNENKHKPYIQYEIFSKAKIKQLKSDIDFKAAYQTSFKDYLISCNDEKAYSANLIFTTYDALSQYTENFETNYSKISESTINLDQAKGLLKSYFLYYVYSLTEPIAIEEINLDKQRRYIIEEQLVVSPLDGAEISVITARKRDAEPLPAVLVFTIFADASNYKLAILAASKGYAGVVANSRGKRLSKNAIEPYIHEHKDVYNIIDWISQQPWSNSKVGMYGGSYNGFSQWASMKEKVHPALKTIIPSVSFAPGIDAPMENNIFYNFPYRGIPYVTNNKFLDNAANFDSDRWNDLENTWFVSGKPYNKMDSIEGTPRPLFQEWISHPSYDSYWQAMIPYKNEFSHINIPILSTTGYYDDGQRGAMYYYLEHLKYNPEAEHYLLIGPYDHWGAQFASSSNLRGYQIDDVAQINIRDELVFDWFDYILKGKEKPSILKNKVNFQVMGTNQWMHKSSLSAMSNELCTFYLGNDKSNGLYSLISEKPKEEYLKFEVNFADRKNMNNSDYYPWPIIKDSIDLTDGLIFVSEPFKKESIINGSFSGNLKITANKKDFDFSIILYELNPEGKYFHLSYYIGRASYAKSRSHRELLKPNKETTIIFDNTRIVSKKISKGSRIIVVIRGNKNSYGQINYGTGKDISKESIIDATIPLELKVNTQSKIILPMWIDN